MLRGKIAVLAALATLVLFVYGRVGGFDFVSFDDGLYVVDNPQVQKGLTGSGIGWALTSFHAANWHPLTWLSLMLDRSLFGPGPGGFHLVNLFLHLTAVLLLFLALSGLTGSTGPSALAAALFAVHPLHVESVAWVAERKDVLAAVFWMLATLSYLRYARRPTAGRSAAVAVVFALGLMAKPMLVTLPCVLLLLDWWPLGRLRRPTAGRMLAEKAPLFALAAASSAVTWFAQNAAGALGSLELIPLSERLSNALVSFVRYLGKLLWPAKLAVYYTHPLGGLAPAPVVLAVLVLAAVTALALAGRRRPYLLVGWLWFGGVLVPVIGLVQVGYQAMADRYAYLPFIGLYVAFSWLALDTAGGGRLRARLALALAVVAAFSALSFAQLGRWRDSRTLFAHALEISPDSELVLNNMAQSALAAGNPLEAIPYLARSLAIAPDEPVIVYNMGRALLDAGKDAEAVGYLSKAVRLNSGFGRAHLDLGVALAKLGRVAAAVPHFREAVRLDPGDKAASDNLGRALSLTGEAAGPRGSTGRR